MILIVSLYFILYSFLAWKNFRWAMGIFVILLPSYLIRFNIGPLPTTLLEISFWALFFVWLLKYFKEDRKIIREEIKSKKVLYIFIGLFFVATVAGIFASDMWYYSLGQWRAYFLEPMMMFFILVGRCSQSVIPAQAGMQIPPLDSRLRGNDNVSVKDIIWFLMLSSISVSALAIIQKLTGHFYPPSLWDDNLNGRAVSFFTSPNAVGLYLAPIVMLVLGVIARRSGATTKQSPGSVVSDNLCLKTRGLLRRLAAPRNDIWIPAFAGMTALSAIFFSFSQGAWIALGVGLVIFAYSIGYKKTAVAAILVGVLLSFSIAPIRSAVMFQDKAGQNRLELWGMSWNYLSSSPKNFVFGAGIRQFFRKVQKPVYEPQEMERLIYPHNIFLNFWTEIGLLGMISFAGILVYGFFRALKIRKTNLILGSALAAALAVLTVHGLVDVPYFKNDLAFLFWIVMSVIIVGDAKTDNVQYLISNI